MLKHKIGADSGDIWQKLSENGKISVRRIGELTNNKESEILLALGWLARENKIQFSLEGNDIYIELNNSIYETYY